MLTIFYNNISVHKLGMWIRFRSMIESIFSSDDAPDALLLGNYRIGKDLDWDAILVVGKEVIIFEFKPIHTKRVIITNKRWADDRGDTIFPGKRAETLSISSKASSFSMASITSRQSCSFQMISNYATTVANLTSAPVLGFRSVP